MWAYNKSILLYKEQEVDGHKQDEQSENEKLARSTRTSTTERDRGKHNNVTVLFKTKVTT